MMPQWMKEGYRSIGPGQCVCPTCGKVVSTNALARARHKESNLHNKAKGDESSE